MHVYVWLLHTVGTVRRRAARARVYLSRSRVRERESETFVERESESKPHHAAFPNNNGTKISFEKGEKCGAYARQS